MTSPHQCSGGGSKYACMAPVVYTGNLVFSVFVFVGDCISYCLRPFGVKVSLVTAIKDHLTSARIVAELQAVEI